MKKCVFSLLVFVIGICVLNDVYAISSEFKFAIDTIGIP